MAARAPTVMKPMNASQPSSRTSSTPAAADNLRARPRRLISGLDDDGAFYPSSAPSTRMASPRGSPSRSGLEAAPLPSKHPSRTSVRGPPRSQPSDQSRFTNGSRQHSSGALSSLLGAPWKTWQGLASNVMGSDNATSSGAPSSTRKSRLEFSPRPAIKQTSSQWGPPGPAPIQIGGGTKEERETLVRAAKRKDLMRANGDSFPDSNGKYKRRTSDEFSSSSVQPGDMEDRDALVYVHRVRPQDTFMGLTIRYNCQADVLRKANRMWHNDSVQSRNTIYLPVDACGVKGRPVLDPQNATREEDLLGDETMMMHESPSTPTGSLPNGWSKHDIQALAPPVPEQRPPSSSTSTTADCEPQWKHDSWVLLPNETEPTEIGRMPRRNLSFFPRARRKSVTFSDLGTPKSITPTTSFDLPRIPSSPGSAQSEAYAALRPSLSRNRSSSNAAFPATSLFNGPGGVGTLGKNVRTPGPAKDRLNELLGPHLPSVAPPASQTVFTPWNPGLSLEDDLISFGAEGVSASSGGGTGVDFQEIGGVVERWMRKTAKRAATALETSSAAAAAKGNAGVQGMSAGSGIGDLIELTDAFELADDQELQERAGIDISQGLNGSSSTTMGVSAADGVRGRKLNRDLTTNALGKGGKGD